MTWSWSIAMASNSSLVHMLLVRYVRTGEKEDGSDNYGLEVIPKYNSDSQDSQLMCEQAAGIFSCS